MDNRKKIALLIDYDNFNQEKYIKILTEELEEVGDILIKYAFYSNFEDKTIKEKFIKHGIQPMSQIAYSKGKNAVDIRMTIAAMSLLNKEYIDTICLATSDSDFTPLVFHLQENNKFVIGAGDNKAIETYKNSFNSFISVEKITHQNDKISKNDNQLNQLIQAINHIISKNHDEQGYADFSAVVQTLKNQMKDFNPKNYGASNKQALPFFKEKLKNYFELKKISGGYHIKNKK